MAVTLTLCACTRAPQAVSVGPWIAGTNYKILSRAYPTGAPSGNVQVLEAFWYGCPHCYALDPYLESWRMRKPAYIQFVRVPVTWGAINQAHARLFYTLQVLGELDQLHSKVFAAIHQQGDPLYVDGNYVATLEDQERFAKANGISGTDFVQAYGSAAVDADLKRATQLTGRYKIDSVPTIIIDGRYESDVSMAGSDEKLIALINALAASAHGTLPAH